MRLEQTNYNNAETGCCAKLEPATWNGRRFEWNNKPFLKDHIRSFMHVPLNYGSVISRDHAKVQEAAAYPEEPFWLTDEVSPWGADLYVAINREIPEAPIEKLSGTFVTKLVEGPYRNAGKWANEMEPATRADKRADEKALLLLRDVPKVREALRQEPGCTVCPDCLAH